ncbi:hypothetical protein JW960_12415, partial [candidate division KSB1 bacterium]|nr:hypothetical protein [candidate division KSB1 bacterium]
EEEIIQILPKVREILSKICFNIFCQKMSDNNFSVTNAPVISLILQNGMNVPVKAISKHQPKTDKKIKTSYYNECVKHRSPGFRGAISWVKIKKKLNSERVQHNIVMIIVDRIFI